MQLAGHIFKEKLFTLHFLFPTAPSLGWRMDMLFQPHEQQLPVCVCVC